MSCHKILKAKGYRLTPQRMLVIEALHNAEDHISAQEIYKQLHSRYPYSNISTVYRTLELMEKLNLVTETDFGEGRVRYHVAEKGHHHHLVCRRCGRIISGKCDECRNKEELPWLTIINRSADNE